MAFLKTRCVSKVYAHNAGTKSFIQRWRYFETNGIYSRRGDRYSLLKNLRKYSASTKFIRGCGCPRCTELQRILEMALYEFTSETNLRWGRGWENWKPSH